MTERTCCRTPLFDTGYIGGTLYNDHVVSGQHDWSYDGQTCCREGAQRWHQTCPCKAARWVEPTAGEQADRIIAETEHYIGRPVRAADAHMITSSWITPEQVRQAAVTAEVIRRLADQSRHMPPLNDRETP